MPRALWEWRGARMRSMKGEDRITERSMAKRRRMGMRKIPSDAARSLQKLLRILESHLDRRHGRSGTFQDLRALFPTSHSLIRGLARVTNQPAPACLPANAYLRLASLPASSISQTLHPISRRPAPPTQLSTHSIPHPPDTPPPQPQRCRSS